MDEPLSPLNPMKCVKTYSKSFTSHSKFKLKSENESTNDLTSSNDEKKEESLPNKSASKNDQKTIKKGPLTTRNAVKMLLEDTLKDQVCRYCLNVCENLSSIEELITIGTRSGVHSIAVKEMIASFYPVRVDTNPSFPSKICPKCLDRTINSYLFAQQCDQSDRAFRDCFEDIIEKVDKLDPLERTKKRGRQKLKPNYNIINTEHKYVIDYADPNMHIISTIISSPDEPKIQDLECLKCSQVLPDITSLLNHVKTHLKSTWFNCRLCGKSFPKLQHLKKHFRNDHSSKTTQKEITNFTCNECGINNSNYQEFLQHIEKHKFKTTLEHVLSCNMDKLCAICFDKGSNMVSIHKEINLHGGFEELTGEKTVGSMISTTLPEKNYKYQELYVANHANIITLRKKNNSQNPSEFIFTSPFIIFEGNVNKHGNVLDDYIFLFNEPQKSCEPFAFKEPEAKKAKYDVKSLENSEEYFVEVNSMKNKISDLNNENSELEKSCETFAFKEPEVKTAKYDDKSLENTGDSEENFVEVNSMKNKITNLNSVINENSTEINKCNEKSKEEHKKFEYVFIFPNPIMDLEPIVTFKDKTEFFIIHEDTEVLKKDSQVIKTNDDKTPKLSNVVEVLKNIDECEIQNKDFEKQRNDIEKINKEEKIVTESNTKETDIIEEKASKAMIKGNVRKPWQCTVCLTNNEPERDVCFCCEHTTYSDVTKFNFKSTSSYNYLVTTLPISKENAYAYLTEQDEQNVITTEKNNSVSEIIKEGYNIPNEEKAINNQKYNDNKDIEMETEIISNIGIHSNEFENQIISQELNIIKPQVYEIPINIEAMDIEEDTVNQVNKLSPIQNTIPANNFTIPENSNKFMITENNNDKIWSSPLQFNIGTGSGDKGKKYKRPLRNVTRAFHK